MTREQILAKLKSVILGSPDLNYRAKNKGVEASFKFREDLGLDSILLIALLCELQADFPFLNEEDLVAWQTVDDCLNSVAKGLTA